MAKERKKEDLLNAISEAIPSIKESIPQATDDEISDAIMDYISSLVSNPKELISKLTLPTKKELPLYSRSAYLKAERSRLKFKKMEETKYRLELVSTLAGMTDEARTFSDHITKFESCCIEKEATLMRIDSDFSRLTRFNGINKTEKDIERLWSHFGE